MEGILRAIIVLMLTLSAEGRRTAPCDAASIDTAHDSYRDRYQRQPNIVYIMADDLGWNDVGFHNPKVKTPHIDALRTKGIELTQSYMQPICSASRSAFMTGKYPSNNGLQLLVIMEESLSCLPLEHKTIFEYMKDEGYVTKQVGKWHLGYCEQSCLPESRGVDEFRGIKTGQADYYNWTDHNILQRQVNGSPSTKNIGTHLTIQDTRDVQDMILDHKGKEAPLFMWITPTAPHTPLQNGGSGQTSTYAGHEYYANNYPLRNGKSSFMEGGTRVPTIYYDPRLRQKVMGTKRDFLIHVTDWLPTFVQLAKVGEKTPNFEILGLDGVSQLANLGSTYRHPNNRKYNLRKEMLVALSDATADLINTSDCATEDAAYRFKDYKLIYGDQYYLINPDTLKSEWPQPEESPDLPDITGDNCHRVVDGKRVVRCLFNVVDDPSETRNLYDEKPEIVAMLMKKIRKAKREAVKPVYSPTLGLTNRTVQPFGEYVVPKQNYCTPSVDFPLLPIDPVCYSI
ncbi:arylsulfatase J-like [Watersipora subatra]|uniref:arylsulfatase J-like n=1 Tax=Watersipora subatra TaxID=2589382 RepID=UPI00355C0FDC